MSDYEKIKIELPGQRLYVEDTYSETFTCGDVKEVFMIVRNSDDQRLVSLINRKCNLDVNELYIADFKYLLHWQRINSYTDNPMRVKWRCRHCGQVNNNAVTTDNLVETPLDPTYEAEGMMISLPSFDTLLPIRLQKVKDDFDVRKYYKEVERVLPDGGQLKEGIVACMLDIEGASLSDKIKLIREKFRPDDMYVIEQFETEFKYGIEDYIEIKCSNKECGEQSEVAFTFDLTSFFPSVSDSRLVRDRVFSRKAPKTGSFKDGSNGLRTDDVDAKSSLSRVAGAEGAEGERASSDAVSNLSVSEITESR